MKYSFVIPVYNRPEEVGELLASLAQQSFRDFEIVLVEDGSSLKSDQIAEKYKEQLAIHYFFKPNEGRSKARNYGLDRAQGDYLIVLDSDCIIPEDYLKIVDHHLGLRDLDAFGGPDAALPNFTPLQKAINYAMTSLITTGGIRGKKKKVAPYQARSFNMGFRKEVYHKLGGFKTMIGEDIDLSIRIHQAGFRLELISEAFVYHKRRTSFQQFYKQVNRFGQGRVNLMRLYPQTSRWVYGLPSMFLLFCLSIPVSAFIDLRLTGFLGAILGLYIALIFSDSLNRHKNIQVAGLSVVAVFIQMFSYGSGFLKELLLVRKARVDDWHYDKPSLSNTPKAE